MTPGTLFIVATPIGHLGDITLRALETLQAVDAVLCEDTRVTKKLLSHYEIQKPVDSFHEHTAPEKIERLIGRLREGESLALVTDAGTPGLSDPGNVLVARAAEAGIPIVPIPGASALTALISVAGIDLREFVFKGFPPHKKGRQTFFREALESELPVIYYESPHRFLKNLDLLEELGCEKRLIVGRELTKMFESIRRGTLREIREYFAAHPEEVRGEFTVILFA